ncbi:5'-3' exoribonuclease 4 [Halotydeus destructor]|nr:5'-3' exoribonuclease 4 [Halotydeus destructor]
MGVPAFFRWLSKKYPAILLPEDGSSQGQDKLVFDNLYLDMNGIIHPCTHPEHQRPPQNENEMFLAIFDYIERILKVVKPTKLLYMAIDGVAPRAKMNQQRSRRFRASQEANQKELEIQRVKDYLANKGVVIEQDYKQSFDSNVITPGTTFMENLSTALRSWIQSKLSPNYRDRDSIWPKDLVVILSDASVPGEGEHKIMDYIRRQRASAGYDPNLSHVLCGADADLIMLGLATHELKFTILREEFIPNQPPQCEVCNQLGHAMKDCEGTVAESDEETVKATQTGFLFIRINVLREYLERESGGIELERFIDDFVFLCFFVGNDFLPHLPSLEIQDGAIDRLLEIYKDIVRKHGYLTQNGVVELEMAQLLLKELGKQENIVFQQRKSKSARFHEKKPSPYESSGEEDLVELGDDGWKERYYYNKFDCAMHTSISSKVAEEYVLGLCWVLRYYYQGCPDWQWFYPFHYAPFASDFVNIADKDIKFKYDTKPFKPLEQLMSVFPAASGENLPPSWRKLMTELDSPIVDFYPSAFKVDLNGKKAAWMGVALLPFIDESRLADALTNVYVDLSPDDKERNSVGQHLLFVSKAEKNLSGYLERSTSLGISKISLVPADFNGMNGSVESGHFDNECTGVHCFYFTDPQFPVDFVFPANKLPNATEPAKILKPQDFAGKIRPTKVSKQSSQQKTLPKAGQHPSLSARHQHENSQYNQSRRSRDRNNRESSNSHCRPEKKVPLKNRFALLSISGEND